MLVACASERIVYRDRTVEVPVPVIQPVPAELLKPCAPRTDVPYAGSLTIAQVLDRHAAVEDALAMCWNQIELIRGRR